MILRPAIAAALFDTPLMVHPGKARAALMGMGGRIVEGGVEVEGAGDAIHHVAFAHGRPSMGTVGDRMGRRLSAAKRSPLDIDRNIAVIPVEGSLVHKGAWLDSYSGDTSYQGIQTQVLAAYRDLSVKGVAFEVDSYGGEVSGAYQTAEMIAQLSAAKPTIAILTDDAYSAGYLLASAARQIVMPESGGAGSIGVITLHADMSKAYEGKGINVSVIHAGAHKADGNPFEPLPDAVRASLQTELDNLRDGFAAAVGRYRGARFTKQQALATEADSYSAAEAVNLGLADAIGMPIVAYEAFVSAVNRA